MKKILLVFTALILTICAGFSQEAVNHNNDLAARFKSYYNDSQFDSIYYLFSNDARVSFPLDKTKTFLSQLKSRYSNINNMTLLDDQPDLKVYKALFDQGILSIHFSINNSQAMTALYVRPYEGDSSAIPKKNLTSMSLPFRGEWTVFWGGDTKDLNYHVVAKFQKNAFDIVRNGPDGKSYRTDGKTNEDYYAFGEELIAPCDVEVITVVEGIKDNIPGITNPLYAPGNSVLLKTKTNEYILIAHIKQHSTAVRQGQHLLKGALLGLCGNSGNSSEPHLHFHLQNIEDLSQAAGIKCYFDKLDVNGMLKTDYSPIKGDRVQATKK